MDANSIRVLREIASFPLPDATAVILTETDGYTKEETEFQMARILEVFRKNGVTEIEEAASAEDAEKQGWTAALLSSAPPAAEVR